MRGIGPSLAPRRSRNAVLADPNLELRDGNGSLLVSNNDWQDNPVQAAEIIAAGLAPINTRESAIAATLPPGLYTALLFGPANGTGIGVVEVYDRGAAPPRAVTPQTPSRFVCLSLWEADRRGTLSVGPARIATRSVAGVRWTFAAAGLA